MSTCGKTSHKNLSKRQTVVHFLQKRNNNRTGYNKYRVTMVGRPRKNHLRPGRSESKETEDMIII
jgi:hypothetical protein